MVYKDIQRRHQAEMILASYRAKGTKGGVFLVYESLRVVLHPIREPVGKCHWKQMTALRKVIQFSCSVVSDSLRPHELQHARPLCPSPTPRVHPNLCPLSWWCHPAISSAVVPFSSCPQSLLASESFPMSQLFAWGGQSIGVSALASVLPKNTQGWSPLEWTGWISKEGCSSSY